MPDPEEWVANEAPVRKRSRNIPWTWLAFASKKHR